MKVSHGLLADELTDEPVVEFGRYQLLRVIGRGGMGQVFEAWDTQLERRVAIKVLTDNHSDDLAFREARCLARVAHPHVVSVHDVGRVESLVFIAMELVDGPNLGRWLRERPRRWASVFDCLLAAGRGLVAVHNAGLVHGDVKPGNVVVGSDGRVRIADFGLARVRSRVAGPAVAAAIRRAAAAVEAELAGSGPDASTSSSVMGPVTDSVTDSVIDSVIGLQDWPERSPDPGGGGTKPYMAPECLAGVPHDPACADQYSLCAMAWEALFGVRPYAGNCAVTILGSIAANRLDRGKGRPLGMPRAIEAVLLRGLSEVPEQRWPSVEALLVALERSRRVAAVPGLFRGFVGGAFGLAFGGALIGALIGALGLPGASPQAPASADLCVDGAGLNGAGAVADGWGTWHQAMLEQREDLRFASVWVDGWRAEWTKLWSHACAVDDVAAACLQHERARLDVVLGLLFGHGDQQREPASPAVARALLSELGRPSVCIDSARPARPAGPAGPAGPDGPEWALRLAHVAELARFESRVELAARAGRDEQATQALAEFAARVGQLGGAGQHAGHAGHAGHADDSFVAAARVRVVRWQARFLIDAGDHQQAALVLRTALAEANRLGLEQSRFDLLLERVRLAQAIGKDSLDDVAALGSLAQRLELQVEVHAELVLVQANATGPIRGAGHLRSAGHLRGAGHTRGAGHMRGAGGPERITRALASLAAAQAEAPRLESALVLARGRQLALAGRFDEALRDVETVLAFTADLGQPETQLEIQAHVLRAQIGARTDRCELTVAAIEHLRATMPGHRGQEGSILIEPFSPLEPDPIMAIIHAFESPVSPTCKRAHVNALALVRNRRQSVD